MIPSSRVVAALTLALGIGAATAIFSAVNPILFRALPYPGAERIVAISDRAQSGAPAEPTYGTYEELASRSRSFETLSAADLWRPSLTGTDEAERLQGQRVSASYFHTLGVLPAAGRTFDSTEDVPGAARVAVLSDRLVKRRFGGDGSMVGTSITLNGEPYCGGGHHAARDSSTSWRQPPTSGRRSRRSRARRLTLASGAITTGSSAD